MSRICPNCGATLQDDELFCCECGTKYEEPAPPEPEPEPDTGGFCAKCGTQLRPGAAFCPKCGAPRQEAGTERPVRERPAKPARAASRPGGNRTAVIIAIIAAVTVIAVVLVLWLAGVFSGEDSSPFAMAPGIVGTGTDGDVGINIGGDDLFGGGESGDELSFPGTGDAALIPAPSVGTLSRVENLGGGSWVVYYTGVTVEQGKSYYSGVKTVGFTEDEVVDDQTAAGGRYAVRAYNKSGVMFEMVCQNGNMGLYIGEEYD